MKKLIVLLAATSLSGCSNEELDRCIKKADMRYQACMSPSPLRRPMCDQRLEKSEESCETEHG